MKQLTVKEARRLVYKLSFRVWVLTCIIFLLILFVLYFIFPIFGFFTENIFDLNQNVVLVPLISALLYPIALILSYKLWIRNDAKLIWKDASVERVNEIYKKYLDSSISLQTKYGNLAQEGWYIPTLSVIFKDYIIERNKALGSK